MLYIVRLWEVLVRSAGGIAVFILIGIAAEIFLPWDDAGGLAVMGAAIVSLALGARSDWTFYMLYAMRTLAFGLSAIFFLIYNFIPGPALLSKALPMLAIGVLCHVRLMFCKDRINSSSLDRYYN